MNNLATEKLLKKLSRVLRQDACKGNESCEKCSETHPGDCPVIYKAIRVRLTKYDALLVENRKLRKEGQHGHS